MKHKCKHEYSIEFLGIDPRETWQFCNKCGQSKVVATNPLEILRQMINQKRK